MAKGRSVYKTILFLFLIFTCLPLKPQRVPELGFSIGTSQYIGDLNPTSLIYNPSVAASGEFIYNLNNRTAIKTGILYYTIKGDGHLRYMGRSYDFTNRYFNYHLMYMVNFYDYNFSLNKNNFTPYFTLGLAYSRVLSTNTGASSNIVLPFGPGIRYLYKNKISLGLEYLFNRTFVDTADGEEIQNFGHVRPSASPLIQSNVGNIDWFTYLCVTITFKFINFADKCPAYQ